MFTLAVLRGQLQDQPGGVGRARRGGYNHSAAAGTSRLRSARLRAASGARSHRPSQPNPSRHRPRRSRRRLRRDTGSRDSRVTPSRATGSRATGSSPPGCHRDTVRSPHRRSLATVSRGSRGAPQPGQGYTPNRAAGLHPAQATASSRGTPGRSSRATASRAASRATASRAMASRAMASSRGTPGRSAGYSQQAYAPPRLRPAGTVTTGLWPAAGRDRQALRRASSRGRPSERPAARNHRAPDEDEDSA